MFSWHSESISCQPCSTIYASKDSITSPLSISVVWTLTGKSPVLGAMPGQLHRIPIHFPLLLGGGPHQNDNLLFLVPIKTNSSKFKKKAGSVFFVRLKRTLAQDQISTNMEDPLLQIFGSQGLWENYPGPKTPSHLFT